LLLRKNFNHQTHFLFAKLTVDCARSFFW